ncbi:PAS domain S-box protein [Bradyrhizobium sp. WSM 1744]|uniref:histidine kinase n=1 Tax=Bradyrhizobium archetypum TaxID=2721160 RepID=A0A7Y4HAD6_9BRAD|nr:PAS domain S-box protein [Bradyrhizobium archetypum]
MALEAGMTGMNIQQRTAKTLSQPGRSASPDATRVPAEELLRAHEDRLAVTYDHVGVGIVDIDQTGRILRVNQEACDLMGRDAADLLGRSIFEETSPLDVAQDLDQFRRQVAGEIDRYTIEKRFTRKDGSHFWAEVTSSSVRDASGNFLYAVRVQHDISARKEAEQARCAAEERAQLLASIVESSDDAIISKDLDGIIRTWNSGAERLFGYSAREAIGKPVTILFPPGREDEEPAILARIRRGERIHHYETVRRRKDGTLLDISLTVSPVRDSTGKITGASKIARDITDRKEAERKLQESEQRLSELLAAIPAAIYTTDAQGKITYFNQAAVEFSGRTPVLGSDEWCVTWKLFNPDGTPLPHDQCPMAVALKEGRAVRGAEAVAERPDGTRVPFIPFPTPLRDSSGKVIGAINMLVDISERRQAETQQRLLLDELNHRTKNNMQMLQSLLFSAARTAHSEEARKVLNEASARIAAMAAAQRVLYGRSDASRFAAEEFLPAVCETIRQSLPPEARIECGAARGVLSNDVAMPLALILNELLTNAVKHGIKDHARHGVRVSLAERDGHLTLCVEDDGEGFDLEEVRQTSSGLQLVLGLARQLRGTFCVTKNPSRACLDFPAAKS